MAEQVAKRQKKVSGKASWTITFQDASSFRSVIESVGSIMPRVIFSVVKEDGQWFLTTNGSDTSVSCFLSARLKLDDVVVDGNDSSFQFCVECKHVSNALDSGTFMSVVLQGYEQDAKIKITSKDPDRSSYEDGSILNTFMEADQGEKLDDMEYNQMLEIDLSKLKEIIKKARKASAEHLRIQIMLKTIASTERSCVVFSADGEQYHDQKYYHETSQSTDGSRVVRAAPDGSHDIFDDEDVEPIFDHLFMLNKIEAFIKNIPCKMITAKIRKGIPMMMEYDLNGEGKDSHIWFLVAPVNDED